MKLYLIVAMLLLITALPISSADNSISNFVKVEDFPEYSSGSTPSVEAEYSFSAKYTTTLCISFVLFQEKLNETGEWDIIFMLDGNVVNDSEISPGIFVSDELTVTSGTYILEVIADAKPNVIPATYTYNVTLLSEDVVIKSDDNGGRSRGTSPYTATPLGTLAPTPTSTPIPTIIVQEVTSGNNTTIVIVATEEPTDLWSYWPLLVLLFLILLFIYLRKKLEDKDESVEKSEQ